MKFSQLMPLKFRPILKGKIWGGQKLINQYNKQSKSNQIGESWELSQVEGHVSEVDFPEQFKGLSLNNFIETSAEEFLGLDCVSRFGKTFPILFKFIDAKQTLSVQLHPDDSIAKKKHNSFGKTEMWYIMASDQDAFIIIDFNKKLSKQEYIEAVKKGTLVEHLQKIPVKAGDVFFIEPGLVHAIGKGVVLAEIQQTSDITYRIFDWNRVDSNGHSRDLHTSEALEAINFNTNYNFKIDYDKNSTVPVKLVHCKYFKTNFLNLKEGLNLLNYSNHKNFVVLMCVEGHFKFTYNSILYRINKGETLFVPACVDGIELNSTNCKLLEVSL
ncbi:type I phosphomannose isomerase catalytic subunit [Psychroflexus sp. ALD_RP9]|uniref:type I phosphomannose isomerase catalytic subunit n=1 Tax=Psychroflexus sp. ALD_RP9 TaxID=2777186 RepID=UPI001A8C5085|nr:type I phosphomannose isomerase catalytic subunit [Psychroflexus sp. ALD_RP9]QSS97525.1 class I mannose-6-phosphate isomerase [Psychroflexus sp. ALD_RP9]